METKKLTTEQIEDLQKPLDALALKQHPTKAYLTTINSAFMIERLNAVFGIGSWTVDAEIIEKEAKMIVVKTTLQIPSYGIILHSFGGNENTDRGDSFKGAMTDGFTKCCSYLGIGLGVWKNEKQATASDIAGYKTPKQAHASAPVSYDEAPDWDNPEYYSPSILPKTNPTTNKVCEAPGCGQDMVYRSGTKNGKKWEAYFCRSDLREHTIFL